jgi:hypothetical protein
VSASRLPVSTKPESLCSTYPYASS